MTWDEVINHPDWGVRLRLYCDGILVDSNIANYVPDSHNINLGAEYVLQHTDAQGRSASFTITGSEDTDAEHDWVYPRFIRGTSSAPCILTVYGGLGTVVYSADRTNYFMTNDDRLVFDGEFSCPAACNVTWWSKAVDLWATCTVADKYNFSGAIYINVHFCTGLPLYSPSSGTLLRGDTSQNPLCDI